MLATVDPPAGFGVAGLQAELQLDIDDAEHERRHAAGLGVATGHGFGGLNVLMALPHGLPVPLSALTDHQRAYVRGVPAAICTVTGDQVVRHATRPCRVQLATVRAASASHLAWEAVEKFTAICARRVIISRAPSVHFPEKLLEFGVYGIGVCLQHPAGNWRRWWSRARGGRSGTHPKPGGSPKPPTASSSPSSHPPTPPHRRRHSDPQERDLSHARTHGHPARVP